MNPILSMNKILILILMLANCIASAQVKNTQLKVSDNGRYLTYADGKPFFWLADTGWELFHRLDREEATFYLSDRAKKGYSVVQAVVWAELDGASSPNKYGNSAFINNDPTKPNEKYFEHVDFIVNQAQKNGLYIGMLPTWGDKWNKKWGNGPEVFTPENAYIYGKWIGNRYKDKPMVWILGGDRNPENETHYRIIQQMAKGLKEGADNKHLITYHPMGTCSSSTFFHQENWLDFNMTQSGHSDKYFANHLFMNINYAMKPAKPTLDGEPRYEDLPLNFWELKYPEGWAKNPLNVPDSCFKNGWFDAFDVRRAAYMAMMAGACGHTYGHNSVWQMWSPGFLGNIPVKCTWKVALERPGNIQMGYMRKFFESFDWQKGIPSQHLLFENWSSSQQYNMALADAELSFVALYSSVGHEIKVNVRNLKSKKLKIKWYDSRKGIFFKEEQVENQLILNLTPPEKNMDWAILIETI